MPTDAGNRLARPNPEGTASVSHGAIGDIGKTESSALLVVANVAAWDTSCP